MGIIHSQGLALFFQKEKCPKETCLFVRPFSFKISLVSNPPIPSPYGPARAGPNPPLGPRFLHGWEYGRQKGEKTQKRESGTQNIEPTIQHNLLPIPESRAP
jgi:hypothetical protein